MENVNKTSSIVKYVGIGSVAIIAIAILIRMISKSRSVKSGNRVTTDDNVAIATELNSAIHTGRNFFTNLIYESDKSEIFKIGRRINDYEDVAKEYQNLYQTSLTHELQDALDKDYVSFLKLLKGEYNVNNGNDEQVPSFSDQDAKDMAFKLFKDMDGFTWSHDVELYKKLSEMEYNDYIRVVNAYDEKYGKFSTKLDAEIGGWDFSKYQTAITFREVL